MKALALFAAAAVLLSPSFLFAADTAYPLVTSIAIAPASVDVTEESQTIVATIQITDDESGFDLGNLNIFNQAGKQVAGAIFTGDQRTIGTALDGTYVVEATIPRYAAPGGWRVEALILDNADNLRVFGPQPWHSPFPEPEASQFTVVNEGEVDSTPPEISSVVISPDTFNTDNGDVEVTLTITTTDALSGFASGYIHLRGPDNGVNSDIFGSFASWALVPGEDDVYELTMTVPQGSEKGAWTVDVEIIDMAGNNAYHRDTRFVVESPSIFLAEAVDALQLPWITSGSGWILQTDDTLDNIDAAMSRPTPDGGESVMKTTVTGPGTLTFDWRVDSEEYDVLSVEVVDGDSEQISGSTGWNTVSLEIPAGEQTVIWRYTKDSSSALGEDRGWVDQVRFIADPGETDSDLPRLQGLHFSTRSPDISEEEAVIDFTIQVSDNSNGFSEGRIELYDSGGGARISTSFHFDDRDSGDEWFSTYHVSLPVGEDWPLGRSKVRIELTEALTGETRIYAPGEEDFPIEDMEVFHVIDGTGDDTEAPVLRALEVTPRVVDVTNGPATVTVTLRMTDNGRGFADGNVTLLTPDDAYAGSHYFSADSERAYDGIYQVEIEIPQYAVPDTWSLSCYLKDHFSNEREYPRTEEFSPNISPSIAVLNSGEADVTAPSVTAFSLTPDEIDTSAAGVPVEITISLTEDLSGIRDAFLVFYSPTGVFHSNLFVDLNQETPIDSDANHPTYHVTRTIPLGSEEGTWRVDVFLRDLTGNARNYWEHGDTLPGSGTFVVGSGTAPSLFESFLSTYSLTGDDALPGADPDGDGRNNATELMLGTDPTDATEAGAGAFALSRDATHLHYDFTIDPALTVTVSGQYLELRDGGGGAPLRLTGQTQAGLAGSWADTLPVLQSGSTWRISLPLAGSPKNFARIFFED